MGTTWMAVMRRKAAIMEGIPNRMSERQFLNSVSQFVRRYPAGVIVDAAYNPVVPQVSDQLGNGRSLMERVQLYAESGAKKLVIITRVNPSEFAAIDLVCQRHGIVACHLPNLVKGVWIMGRWIERLPYQHIQRVVITNVFHAEKVGVLSEGARYLEALIRHNSPDTPIEHAHERCAVPYINSHRICIETASGSWSMAATTGAREYSATAIMEMVNEVSQGIPGLRTDIPGWSAYLSPTNRCGSVSDSVGQAESDLNQSGFALESSGSSDRRSWRHSSRGETVSVGYSPRRSEPSVISNEPPYVCVIGGGAMGTFSAHWVATLGIPVKWVVGKSAPAATTSSQNKHFDIIFKRDTNGEIYNPWSLYRDWLNPGSGLALACLDRVAVQNMIRSLWLTTTATDESRDRNLQFSRMAMEFTTQFWEQTVSLQETTLASERPQLVTRENEASIRELYALLRRRGADVRWESDLRRLGRDLGTPVSPDVVGALIHGVKHNGQIDFKRVFDMTVTEVIGRGGEIIGDDCQIPVGTEGTEWRTHTGRILRPAATVLALGPVAAGVTPITGVSATIRMDGPLRLPTTINRFTFSSVWDGWIRVTSGAYINDKVGELSPKLIRNLAKDLDVLPEISSGSGITLLSGWRNSDFSEKFRQVGRFRYQLTQRDGRLVGIEIFSDGGLITTLSACPGRPFRPERVPLVHFRGRVVDAPACNMAGLNWGPFAGAAVARGIQLVLEKNGIMTPPIPNFQTIESEFPLLSSSKYWPAL